MEKAGEPQSEVEQSKQLTKEDYEARDIDIDFSIISQEQASCESRLETNQSDVEALVKLGFLHIRYYKNKIQAMECFNRVLSLNPNDIDGLLGKCYCILEDKKKHEFDLCQNEIDKCLVQKIKYWRIYYYQSMLYYLRYKDYLSKKALRKAIKLCPNHYLSISLLALIQSEIPSERPQAKEMIDLLFESKQNFKNDFSVYYRAGKIYEKLKLADEAINYFIKSTEFRNNYSQAMKMVSYIYMNQKNDMVLAKEYADKAIQMDPTNDEAFMNLGEVYEKMNQNQNAIVQYQKAIEINPNNETAYLLILDQYEQMGNKKDFHELCQKFVKNNPNSADANFEMAFSFSTMLQKYSSIRYYKRALKIETVVDCFNNLGNVYYQQRDLEESEQYFLKALKHDPEDQSFNDNLNIVVSTDPYDEDDDDDEEDDVSLNGEDDDIDQQIKQLLTNPFMNFPI